MDNFSNSSLATMYTGDMDKSKICENCGREYFKRPTLSWEMWEKRKGCSCSCSAIIRFKNTGTYIRTDEHKKKMSEIILGSSVIEKSRARMLEINKNKKGKTLEQIYGLKKALDIRSKNKKFGKDNNNWKGGKSFVPYSAEFNKKLKEKIKFRDGFVCKNCDIAEEEYRKTEGLGRGLTIHHIDYDKLNCNENNLITLCKRCNSMANSNKQKWINKFQSLLGA